MGFFSDAFEGSAGSIIGGVIGASGTKSSNAMSAREAARDRDWQKMMSDTAHQREVADLKAAGLNPILSAGGRGASVGSGSRPSISDLGSSISKGASSAIALKTALANIRNTNADSGLKETKAAVEKDKLGIYEGVKGFFSNIGKKKPKKTKSGSTPKKNVKRKSNVNVNNIVRGAVKDMNSGRKFNYGKTVRK